MSYEQMPAYFPEVPKDGKKRIFIEKKFETPRDRDMQMSRLRRVGYEPDPTYDNEDVTCLVIDEKIIEGREKYREKKGKQDLLAASKAGVAGELDELSTTKIIGPQNPEAFFDGPEK